MRGGTAELQVFHEEGQDAGGGEKVSNRMHFVLFATPRSRGLCMSIRARGLRTGGFIGMAGFCCPEQVRLRRWCFPP